MKSIDTVSDLQECKGNDFFEVGRMDNNFQKNLEFLDGRLPLPAEKFVEGGSLTFSVEEPTKWSPLFL